MKSGIFTLSIGGSFKIIHLIFIRFRSCQRKNLPTFTAC